MSQCKFCDREISARGMCLMHYKRERVKGTLENHSKQGVYVSHNRLNLSGKRFGRLVVAELVGFREFKSGSTKSEWLCKCDCGSALTVIGSSLTKEHGTRSCGCLASELTKERSTTHGMTETRAYRIWQAMRNRCRNENQPSYENYGGRGITVCERWERFENFIEDMGEPEIFQSIERIDNNGNYEPANCKWASRTEQARNTRKNRNISFNGETKPLIEWAQGLNIDQASLRERLDKWPLEKALTQPRKGL